jgi:hypothetical protein
MLTDSLKQCPLLGDPLKHLVLIARSFESTDSEAERCIGNIIETTVFPTFQSQYSAIPSHSTNFSIFLNYPIIDIM